MKCLKCKKKIPDNSVFCPYCGWEVELPEEKVAEHVDEKKVLTDNQRFYDKDYGYSEDNPIVVSSVAMIGNYLSSLRDEVGNPFEWEFEATDTGTSVKKYNLISNGSVFKSVYFNPNGNDSEYVPAGLALDKEALEASTKGVSLEELRQKKERKKEAERAEKERIAERKKRSKKTVKMIAIIAAAAIVLAGITVALVLNRDNIKYAIANGKMNAGSYDEAISMFDSLGEFKDSKDLINECNYRKAERLFDSEDYETAGKLFDTLSGYKDSKEKKQECDYIRADQLFENKEYEEAADAFEDLNTYSDSRSRYYESLYYLANYCFENEKYLEAIESYKIIRLNYEVDERISDCQYYLSKQYYESGDYEQSYSYYTQLKNNKDLQEKYSIDFENDLFLEYSKELIDDNQLESIEKAISLLKECDNVESRELIKKASDQLTQLKYKKALEYLNAGNYSDAVSAFDEISDYLDSADKRIEAMYKYVKTEKDNVKLDFGTFTFFDARALEKGEYKIAQDATFYKFLKELAGLNYLDSISLYEEITRWRVHLYINDVKDGLDAFSNAESVPVSANIYCHIVVFGGDYQEKTNFQYRITMPDGEVFSGQFDGEIYAGYSGYCTAYYDAPYMYYTNKTGTCTVEVLDINGNSLAKGTIRLT